MSPRRQQLGSPPGDDTKDRILLAALRLFAEKGYGSTSVADILHTANANAGSLYHFFPGKQDLLIAVLETYLSGIHPMLLAPAWKGVDDPIERVFALLGSYRAALLKTHNTYGCPIGSLALEIHEPDPAVRKLIASNFDAWIDAVEACFEEARDRFPRNTNFHVLAVFVLTTMEGGVMLARTERRTDRFDSSVKSLRNYIELLELKAGSSTVHKRSASGDARRGRRTAADS